MLVTNTIYFNENRVFAVDSVLDINLINSAQSLFDLTSHAWSNQDFTHTPGRVQFVGHGAAKRELEDFASVTLAKQVSAALHLDVSFSGLSIWWDTEGYYHDPHYDLPGVNYTLQVYLDPGSGSVEELGTCFYTTDSTQPTVTIDYQHNAGYLAENPWALYHGIKSIVPPGCQRRSVYFRFKDSSLGHHDDGYLVCSMRYRHPRSNCGAVHL